MALFECADCRQMISDKAASCPNCGCPVNEETIRESNLRKQNEETIREENKQLEIKRKQLENQKELEEQRKTMKNFPDKRNINTKLDEYVIDYINENEFRKKERAIKKYNMLAYKKMIFDIYPELRKGNFKGTEVHNNKKENIIKYELKLPTDTMFSKVHGDMMLHYTVYKNEKIILLNTLTPEDVLNDDYHKKELTTYKGVMVSKNHAEKDMFKINLLNMISRD